MNNQEKDWNYYRRRYIEFWNDKISDDRIIAHIQNPNPARPEPEAWMLEESNEKYLDPEKLFKLMRWRGTAWDWHGDLFNYMIPSYGPNVFAGFCGAKVKFGKDTVWHEPVISSVDEADKVHFDPSNYYWKKHLETVDYFCEKVTPQTQLGMTDFGGPTDWMSCLMGTERFLMESILFPQKMRDFALRLVRECNRAFDIVYEKISTHNDGTANWMPVWCDAKMGTAQDDMSVSFSPEMYADIFLPAVEKMVALTEKSVLHWHDGCSQHLDRLLRVDEIDLIQYGHDPNTGSFRDKLASMRKIQAADKNLFISCVEADDAEFFIKNLDPRGLMMVINTENDSQSRKMEKKVAEWTRERKFK